jgi:uracil-DNA glycosylase family 4
MPDNLDKIKDSITFHLETARQMGLEEIPLGKKKSVTAVKPKILTSNRTIEHEKEFQDKSTTLPEIPSELKPLRDHIGDCTRCRLHQGRTHLVFGVGNPKAQLMFVGEAPGADEDASGVPFVGRAGQLLTKMIEAMGLTRSDIYIANIIKCRPPGNRPPEPDEILECIPFLKQQIETINPKVIVGLGKFAAQTLLQTEIPITKLRGEFHDYGSAKLMPTYHPAYLLRNPNMKKAVWEDLQKVMKVLGLKKAS